MGFDNAGYYQDFIRRTAFIHEQYQDEYRVEGNVISL
jgi:hypothetical protein